jgi:hypothetical protein
LTMAANEKRKNMADITDGPTPPNKQQVSFEPMPDDGQMDVEITPGRNVKSFFMSIRLEFPITHETFHAQPSARNAIMALKKTDPSMKIQSVATDETATEVDDVDGIPKNEDGFKKFFTYSKQKPPNGGQKHCIFAKISTSKKFEEIKEGTMEYLQKHHIFMRRHEWKCLIVAAIGFFAQIHPRINWRDDLEEKIKAALLPVVEGKENDIPHFKLVHLTKSFGNENRVHASVIEVHCDNEDAANLKILIADPVFTKSFEGKFVPEGALQIVGEKTYRNILIEHNRYCEQTRTIPITNLSIDLLNNLFNDDMLCIYDILTTGDKNQFKDTKIQLHRTSRTEDEGRYLVAFPKEHMEKVRAHLDYTLEAIVPMMIKKNANGNDYSFKTALPSIAGRPTADPKLANCFAELRCSFASIAEDADGEGSNQQQKKRRTYNMSYADVATTNVTAPTIATKGNNSSNGYGYTTMSAEKMKELMTTEFDKQKATTKTLFAEMAKVTDEKMTAKLDVFSQQQDEKRQETQKTNETAMHSFAVDINKYLTEQQQTFTASMATKLDMITTELTNEQNKNFEALKKSMTKSRNTLLTPNAKPSNAASSRVSLSGEKS